LKPYEIISTGQGCGIIEFLTDTLSIDFIKRKISDQGGKELSDYFQINFGKETSKKY
jgi:phosphatidylinositol kinase/protein kinase (PI-3  family)